MVDEFYDTGENKGRIKGVAAAHELADLEANNGVNAALARERELKRILEGGRSVVEEKYVAIMKGMAGKYPDAFDRQIDGKGREFLQFRGGGEGAMADYFTQYGAFHVELKSGGPGLGTEDVVDMAGYASGIKGGEFPRDIIGKVDQWKMINLADPITQESIKRACSAAQKREEAAKVALKDRARANGAESILANL